MKTYRVKRRFTLVKEMDCGEIVKLDEKLSLRYTQFIEEIDDNPRQSFLEKTKDKMFKNGVKKRGRPKKEVLR